jgi:Zn-finger protein
MKLHFELMSGYCPYSPNEKHFWNHIGFQDGDRIFQCEHCRCGHKEPISVWK